MKAKYFRLFFSICFFSFFGIQAPVDNPSVAVPSKSRAIDEKMFDQSFIQWIFDNPKSLVDILDYLKDLLKTLISGAVDGKLEKISQLTSYMNSWFDAQVVRPADLKIFSSHLAICTDSGWPSPSSEKENYNPRYNFLHGQYSLAQMRFDRDIIARILESSKNQAVSLRLMCLLQAWRSLEYEIKGEKNNDDLSSYLQNVEKKDYDQTMDYLGLDLCKNLGSYAKSAKALSSDPNVIENSKESLVRFLYGEDQNLFQLLVTIKMVLQLYRICFLFFTGTAIPSRLWYLNKRERSLPTRLALFFTENSQEEGLAFAEKQIALLCQKLDKIGNSMWVLKKTISSYEPVFFQSIGNKLIEDPSGWQSFDPISGPVVSSDFERTTDTIKYLFSFASELKVGQDWERFFKTTDFKIAGQGLELDQENAKTLEGFFLNILPKASKILRILELGFELVNPKPVDFKIRDQLERLLFAVVAGEKVLNNPKDFSSSESTVPKNSGIVPPNIKVSSQAVAQVAYPVESKIKLTPLALTKLGGPISAAAISEKPQQKTIDVSSDQDLEGFEEIL